MDILEKAMWVTHSLENSNYMFHIGMTNQNALFFLKPFRFYQPMGEDYEIPKIRQLARKNVMVPFYQIHICPIVLYERKTEYTKFNIKKSIIKLNALHISSLISAFRNPTIIACWGDIVTDNELFRDSLKEIYKLLKKQKANWKSGSLTVLGNPSNTNFHNWQDFDIHNYMKNL